MAQKRDIKYVNRDFDNLRNQLIDFTKNYFPDTYTDFSPTSPGMMFIEMAAYVGDVLSFYQDSQLQETFLQYSKNPGNLYQMAYMMGYRPKVSTPSSTILSVQQIVADFGGQPDWSTAGTLSANSIIRSTSGTRPSFLTQKNVDFNYSSSYDTTEVVDNENSTWTLLKEVPVFSAEIKTTTRTFESAERFSTISIEDENIIGILSIEDSDENTWYEVPFLGQETIYEEKFNPDELDRVNSYNTLELVKTDRRFTTRFNINKELVVQFGAGTFPGETDDSFLPTLENVGLGVNAVGVNRLDHTYDPSNFLYSRTYGLAPANTTLTIRYLVGGGVESNVPANTITEGPAGFQYNNVQPAVGGSDGDTVEEVRQNALRAFKEQGRAVTLEDYNVRVMSLPPTLGSVAKVYVSKDEIPNSNYTTDSVIDLNPSALSVYLLAYDSSGKLTTASSTLKQNLRKYLSGYRSITDALDFKDAFVVNIEVQYEIITYPDVSDPLVLNECTNRLIDYFEISKWNINEPINLTELYTLLDKVKGVQTVENIRVVNKVGELYSEYAYDVEGATRRNIVYPSLDPCVFEVKFPQTDIKGRVVTI